MNHKVFSPSSRLRAKFSARCIQVIEQEETMLDHQWQEDGSLIFITREVVNGLQVEDAHHIPADHIGPLRHLLAQGKRTHRGAEPDDTQVAGNDHRNPDLSKKVAGSPPTGPGY